MAVSAVAVTGSKGYIPGMDTFYGYIRTSRRLQEGVAGMDPATQEGQLRRVGVPQKNIFRNVGISGTTGTQQRRGWHALDSRLAGGDTLVIPWWWSPSTGSGGPGTTPSGPSPRSRSGG